MHPTDGEIPVSENPGAIMRSGGKTVDVRGAFSWGIKSLANQPGFGDAHPLDFGPTLSTIHAPTAGSSTAQFFRTVSQYS